MTGKEALKRIDKILESPITKARGGSYLDIEFIKSIKQDLDRLEKLEYVLLLIVDYQLIDFKTLEEFMNSCELEAMEEVFKDIEDKMMEALNDK